MSDPNLSQHCETLARNNEKAASANANTSVSPRAVDYGALVSLPKPVYILQQPLFDLLRVVFSRGDHSIYSALTFHNAVQLWLVYIQPWKAVSISKSYFLFVLHFCLFILIFINIIHRFI